MKKIDKIKLVQEWQESPIRFFKDHWPKIYIWDKLEEISLAVKNNRRVVIPSGHGVGKTWLMARIVLWFLSSFPRAKVITTAPTWNQVEKLLWVEITHAYNTSAIPIGGDLLLTSLKIREDWFALGISTTGNVAEREYGASKLQGFHSENLLVVLDEAPGVEHSIWVAAETLITADNNKIVAVGNPTSPAGDFYDACKSPLWHKIQVSSLDHPNVKEGRVIVPGAVTSGWIEERRQEWGEDTPLWQAKILGQFPTEGTDTVIPLAWAEACVGLGLSKEGEKKLGCDVARWGEDKTAICQILGQVTLPIETHMKKPTTWTAGRLKKLNMIENFDAIGVDDGGIGGGVTDILTEEGIDVDPINFGSQAVDNSVFDDRFSEMMWNVREAIKDKQIELPDDKELINQLCNRKYTYTRKGKIKVESKDDLKKRGFKSPDKGDAFIVAFNAGFTEKAPELTVITMDNE